MKLCVRWDSLQDLYKDELVIDEEGYIFYKNVTGYPLAKIAIEGCGIDPCSDRKRIIDRLNCRGIFHDD